MNPLYANLPTTIFEKMSALARETPPPAYLIRGHGLYGWGRDIAEAERVIEAAEWLAACEVAERSMRREA